ncbi:DUF1611 domain-containing protein [Sphingomonas sp. BK580]|uniref:DUF1611 domain-containing protein n=1 Tax=Sphingomonas sp. BK580 TaxID=2586972 RepID=UPI00161CC3DD|nr:DUF1611 domain-containing protein [Sphingomonas sp. BK580]MBB3695189.1 putative NAD-dependent epimerase/dehydratase family protein [Sphingomonas sp. BK580]
MNLADDTIRVSGPRGGTSTRLPSPYLLFLGDTTEPAYAKTAFGLRDWARDRCVGQFSLPGATVTTGLPELRPEQAVAAGALGLLIGVANIGGVIPPSWLPALLNALGAGLDLVAGMHSRLTDVPELQKAAERYGRRLFDVRVPPADIPIASGRRRSGRRILTVGTDCALGKKYTALAVARGLRARGIAADFRATGQTGIMIAGEGIPIDAVVSDFVAGAAESLSPAADPSHVDVIEGQGSLFHPSYAGVSLGLLHGSQPDLFIACHQPGRQDILGHPGLPTPSLELLIEQTVALGSLTSPAIRCAGVSLNTMHLDPAAADAAIEEVTRRLSVPAADPIRGGPRLEALLDACMA